MKTITGALLEALVQILHQDTFETKEYQDETIKSRDIQLMEIFGQLADEENRFADKKKDGFKKLREIPEAMRALECVLEDDDFVDRNYTKLIKLVGQPDILKQLLKLLQYVSQESREKFFGHLATHSLSFDQTSTKQLFHPEVL